MGQVYAADGIADSCSFEFTLGIRTTGNPETDTDYHCPDEDVGCPDTAWVACAFDNMQTTKQNVDFLTCWDESQDPSSCASAAGIDYTAMSACQSGSRVAELLKDAAIKFEIKWPKNAHSGFYHTPHVMVNGEEVAERFGRSPHARQIIKALCASGITAGACGSLELV